MEFVNKKFSRYSKYEKSQFWFCYLLIAFPVLQFCVFWIGQNFTSLGLAFTNTANEPTVDNFKQVFLSFGNQGIYSYYDVGGSLLRSFIIWVVSNVICFPISTLTCYVLYKKIPGHYFYRICYIIPGLMGAIVWTSLMSFMIDQNGPIIWLLNSLKIALPEEAINNGLLGSDTTAFVTLLIISSLMGIVGNNAVMTGAYARIPKELFESAEIDGSGFFRTYAQIAIPCIWPTLTTLMIFSLCSIFTADVSVFLYTNGTGDHNTSTIGFLLYNMTYNLSNGNSNVYGFPAALGITLTIITLPIVLFGRRILQKIQAAVEL